MQADTSMCAMLTTLCYVQRKLKRDTKESFWRKPCGEKRQQEWLCSTLRRACCSPSQPPHTQPQDC
eukprot:4720138-Amphidinium_carterae.1